MPLINQSIPNLSQGVSQQPDNIRHLGQGDTQENMYSSVVDGLVARPPSELIGELGSNSVLSADCFIHPINRDPSNRHLLVIEPLSTAIKLYNTADGSDITIRDAPTGSGSPSAFSYLSHATPRTAFQAMTVADTTYLLNKTHEVQGMTTASSALEKKAVVFVKQGDYAKEYHVDIKVGDTITHCTYRSGKGSGTNSSLVNGVAPGATGAGGANGDAKDASTELITQGLWAAIEDRGITNIQTTLAELEGVTGAAGSENYSSSTNANAILIEYTGGSDFNVDVHDGLGNIGTGVIYDHVQNLSSLPTICFNGFKVKVKGDTLLVQDDYHVVFSTKNGDTYDGTLQELHLVNGGTGYIDSTGYPLGISGGGGSGATGTFDVSGGIVTNLQITAAGSGYTHAPTITFPGAGAGTGASAQAVLQANGEGSWAETVAPSTVQNLPASDLPLKIAPQDSGSAYYIAENTWGARTVGDTTTNSQPSFVGETIEQLFFFKNRLGMLSGQNVLFSENDNYTNFFRTSTLSLLDSDRIDVGVSHTKVSFLKHARAFQEKLLLFSNQSQFVLRGNNLLTPSTVNITPVTEYQVQSGVEPLVQGQYIYFPFDRGSYQGLYEYYTDATTDTFRAEEVTSHIPRYIPSEIKHMTGSETEDCIAITTTASDGGKDVYIYKYFWAGNDKIQSSWSKFTFTHDIIGIFFIESDLYIMMEDGTRSFLERVRLESGLVDTGFSYTIRLDSRQKVNDGTHSVTYDASADTTTITPGVDCTGIEVWSEDGNKATEASSTANTITVNGDWRSTTIGSYIGYPISWQYEFTKPVAKQATARDGLTTSKYINQVVRTGSVEYAGTGHFKVEVSKKYRDTFTHVFNPTFLGADSKLDTLVLEDGSFRYPVYSNVNDLTIKLKGSSALPAKFLSAEFESTLAARSRRYAG